MTCPRCGSQVPLRRSFNPQANRFARAVVGISIARRPGWRKEYVVKLLPIRSRGRRLVVLVHFHSRATRHLFSLFPRSLR